MICGEVGVYGKNGGDLHYVQEGEGEGVDKGTDQEEPFIPWLVDGFALLGLCFDH